MGQRQLSEACRKSITDGKLSSSRVKMYTEDVYIKITLFHLFLVWARADFLNIHENEQDIVLGFRNSLSTVEKKNWRKKCLKMFFAF